MKTVNDREEASVPADASTAQNAATHEKQRGSVWGALLGAAVLLLGALAARFFGTAAQRFTTAAQVWTLVGAVLLGYNVWALLRRKGNNAPPAFTQPDPEAEAKSKQDAKAALAELERRYRSGEIGYETYMKKRVEIINGR